MLRKGRPLDSLLVWQGMDNAAGSRMALPPPCSGRPTGHSWMMVRTSGECMDTSLSPQAHPLGYSQRAHPSSESLQTEADEHKRRGPMEERQQ